MRKTYLFTIAGMHCASCGILTKSELEELPHIEQATANLNNNTLRVTGEFGSLTETEIAAELSAKLEQHGYTISTGKIAPATAWGEFRLAVPFALGFLALFILLQKLGVINLISGGGEVTYATAFVVGLVASVSTCMAVVGGLVLSVSANFAKEGDPVKPQALFHVGRLAAFFVLGGLIGVLGASFQLGSAGTFVLSAAVGVVMLLLGLNLLDVFHWTRKVQPTLPAFFSKHISGIRSINHTLTPFFVGVATFFLPCGFTQSMQIYTLGTGSFLAGGFTMTAFALGTLPVLALLSFSSLSIHKKARSGVFFKAAGLVVIFFAVFNILNSLVVIGLLPPLFNFL